jgi:hypothetical protein
MKLDNAGGLLIALYPLPLDKGKGNFIVRGAKPLYDSYL